MTNQDIGVVKVRHLDNNYWKEVSKMATPVKKDLAYYQAKEKKEKDRSLRLRVKNQLYVEKAKAAKIVVTDEEIDKYIANM